MWPNRTENLGSSSGASKALLSKHSRRGAVAGFSASIMKIDKLPVLLITVGSRLTQYISPLLFTLYINSLINELKKAGVGIECRGHRVAALLYADDMVLFAGDEKIMRLGLRILREWCVQWAVKVNAEKCGIMHLRKNGVKRTEEKFEMNGERIEVIVEYKYLGCTINQHLECKGMVKERASAGARALSRGGAQLRLGKSKVKHSWS